jgi:DNA polymerase-3 subunit delta
MKISSEELPHHLASGLKPLYVVYGDAPLLTIESADAIRAAARSAGFAERETLIAEQHFKWELLTNSAQSLSLFASRKMVDLRIPSGKPGTEGGKVLQEYVAKLSPDVLTLITLPKLDWSVQKSQWFNALEMHGVLVAADDVAREALPRWIAGRLKRQGQTADAETLEFLSDRCEGNLLAAFQEIQKLALLFPAGALSFEGVKNAVMDVARYDVSKLCDAMFKGDGTRFVRILEGLKAEGTAALLVAWAMNEDIRALCRVLQAVSRGENAGGAMRSLRIWGDRERRIAAACRRIKPGFAERVLQRAAQIDRIAKGIRPGDVWDELLQLGMRITKAMA